MSRQKKVKEKRGTHGTPQDFLNKVYSSPYKDERIDLENGLIALKYPIQITKDRLAILDKICEVTYEPLGYYLAQALYEKIDSDLNNCVELGRAFVAPLLKEWNINNEYNNFNVLKYSTKK